MKKVFSIILSVIFGICFSAAFSGANKLQLFGYYKDFKWNDEAGCC